MLPCCHFPRELPHMQGFTGVYLYGRLRWYIPMLALVHVCVYVCVFSVVFNSSPLTTFLVSSCIAQCRQTNNWNTEVSRMRYIFLIKFFFYFYKMFFLFCFWFRSGHVYRILQIEKKSSDKLTFNGLHHQTSNQKWIVRVSLIFIPWMLNLKWYSHYRSFPIFSYPFPLLSFSLSIRLFQTDSGRWGLYAVSHQQPHHQRRRHQLRLPQRILSHWLRPPPDAVHKYVQCYVVMCELEAASPHEYTSHTVLWFQIWTLWHIGTTNPQAEEPPGIKGQW